MPNLTAEKKGGAGSSSLGEDANSSVSDVMPSTFHTGRPSPVSHDVGENLSRVPSQSPIMVPPSGSAAANGDAVNPSNPNTPFRAHLTPSGASSFYPLQPWKNTPPPYSTAVSSSVAANVVRSAISPDAMKAGVLSDVVSDTSGVHPSLPCLPPSSRSATPSGQFSHERALENFAKTREILKVHMKARSDNNETTPPGDMPVGDSELGHRLVEVVRSAMDAADKLDNVQSPTPSGRHSADDWRDVGDTVTGPSIFFENEVVTDSCNNRVMESIIAKGHAAQTDDELAWLYRNSMLLNLLEKEDLERVVAQSLRREYMKGDIIVSHRETLRHLYTVVWGDVDVFQAEYIDNDQRAMEGAFRVSTATQLVAESTNRGPSNREGADIPELASQQRASEERGCDVTEGDANATYTNVATLLPGQIFGTEALVFDEKSRYLFRAGGTTKKTVMSLIPFDCLREALYRNPRFSQELVTSISGSFDVFGPIREFCRYVFSPTTSQNEYLPIWSIVEGYTRIHNVIHTKLFSKELDTGAWGYALNRLPENVTSTFCFDLVHALPPFVASRMRVEARAADVRKQGNVEDRAGVRTAIKYIRTKERRRCTWQLGMEGKTLVLLRDGFTDLLDFLTMLCTHIVESNKLRGRVQGMVHPPAIDILDEFLRQREEEQVNNASVSAEEELERARGVLRRMPLTSDEQSGLLRNWGSQAPAKIYEVMMHREEFNVRVDPSISRKFQINPFHEWALNLRGCVLEKLKLDRSSALPSDLYVDVVSSNTHCIKNLLSSFIRKYKSEILAYARKSETKRLGRPEEWHNVDDMLYVSVSGFLQNERPDLKEEYTKTLEESGITVLHDTAMTGLQVDVIPVHLLNLETIDEAIRDSVRGYYEQCFYTPGEGRGGKKNGEAPASWAQVCRPVHSPYSRRKSLPSDATSAPSSMRLPRHFIINMDFAFGAQAEGICRAVFSAFGSHIRSVSVMGKAGGMRGKRGDIQLASHVLLSKSSLIMEDNQDELRSCRNQDLFKERLEELAGPKVTVHHGKVLTVTGTMLQNVQLLKYYKRVWGCVGTEMEGSYFARVIEDFYRQGIAHPDLVTRFAYYTSDMPLGQSEAEEEAAATGRSAGAAVTLSAPMTPQEGVPPLYAIARGILENVLLP